MAVQIFIWAVEEMRQDWSQGLSPAWPIADALKEARDKSPFIEFIVNDGFLETPTILPAGAAELDQPLVAETLKWLSPYPTIKAKFEKALRSVLSKKSEEYRGALDDLRWSLEQLLRAILNNSRPIEDQKPHVTKWMKERGVHQAVIQTFVDLKRHFTEYQNDAVKHGEKWTEVEIEYMVYLTGGFMRLLLRLDVLPSPDTMSG